VGRNNIKAITRGDLLSRSANGEAFTQIGVHMKRYPQVINLTKPSKKKGDASSDRRKKPKNRSEQKAVSKSTSRRKPDVELPAPSYKVIWIAPHNINVDVASRRPVIPAVVKDLVAEIPRDGLRTPLTIIMLNGVANLVTGFQRLEALKILGWSEVPCVIEEDEITAQRWQIIENLYRGELTKLQRANQAKALLALPENTEGISGEKVQKKKRGRPEGGDAKAARTLNVRGKTDDAKRKHIAEDRQISDIHEDAQQALVDAGLDDNGKALREVANQPTREAQLAKVKDLAKGSRNAGPSTSDGGPDEADETEPPLVVLKREWKKAKSCESPGRMRHSKIAARSSSKTWSIRSMRNPRPTTTSTTTKPTTNRMPLNRPRQCLGRIFLWSPQ
jgi:ParB-like chromosome segregation protein Spo0J